MKYKAYIQDNLGIVDKQGNLVPFVLNPVQNGINDHIEGKRGYGARIAILKARQMGCSSYICGCLSGDFLFAQNTHTLILTDRDENSEKMLHRVKLCLETYTAKNKVKCPTKYNSKFELYNEFRNNYITIGTARQTDIGRSLTLSSLMLSECAFFPDIGKILAGAAQAVIPGGKIIIETTANGFNLFKSFWDDSKAGQTGFTPLFFPASMMYTPEFLAGKRRELGRYFAQEYPENDIEAFLQSGDCYFSTDALKKMLDGIQKPSEVGLVYV